MFVPGCPAVVLVTGYAVIHYVHYVPFEFLYPAVIPILWLAPLFPVLAVLLHLRVVIVHVHTRIPILLVILFNCGIVWLALGYLLLYVIPVMLQIIAVAIIIIFVIMTVPISSAAPLPVYVAAYVVLILLPFILHFHVPVGVLLRPGGLII